MIQEKEERKCQDQYAMKKNQKKQKEQSKSAMHSMRRLELTHRKNKSGYQPVTATRVSVDMKGK